LDRRQADFDAFISLRSSQPGIRADLIHRLKMPDHFRKDHLPSRLLIMARGEVADPNCPNALSCPLHQEGIRRFRLSLMTRAPCRRVIAVSGHRSTAN
jgi:hypothetical protein